MLLSFASDCPALSCYAAPTAMYEAPFAEKAWFGGIITRQAPPKEKNQMYRIFLDIEKFIRIPHRAMNAFEGIWV